MSWSDPTGKHFRKGSVLEFSGEFTESIATQKVGDLIDQEREGRFAVAARKLCKK